LRSLARGGAKHVLNFAIPILPLLRSGTCRVDASKQSTSSLDSLRRFGFATRHIPFQARRLLLLGRGSVGEASGGESCPFVVREACSSLNRPTLRDASGNNATGTGFEPRDRISASRLAEAFGWRIRRRERAEFNTDDRCKRSQ